MLTLARILITLTLLISSLLISACGKAPSSAFELAQQGLLSGDLSHDGKTAVVGSIHHGGSLWDIVQQERRYSWNHTAGQFSSLRTSALSGDGKVAVTTEEQTIAVWNTQTGESRGFWQAPARILAIDLNETGSKALIGLANGQANYFDLVRGQVLFNLPHQAEVRSVALNEGQNIAVTGSDDQSSISWSLVTGKPLHKKTFSNLVKQVALSPSGTLAFASSQREDALVWLPESGEVRLALGSRYTNYSAAVFSKDDAQLYLGTFQGLIEQWDIASGDKLASWQATPRKAYGGANSKAIIALQTTDKGILALTSDGQVQVFDR